MRKWKLKALLMGILSALMLCSTAHALEATPAQQGKVFIDMFLNRPEMAVNGVWSTIDDTGTTPVARNGRTLSPVRAVVEAMGGTADWDAATRTAILTCGGDEIRLTIHSKTAYLNGRAHTLDVAPIAMGGCTMLPIRFVAESFGAEVHWDAAHQRVTVGCSAGSHGGAHHGHHAGLH